MVSEKSRINCVFVRSCLFLGSRVSTTNGSLVTIYDSGFEDDDLAPGGMGVANIITTSKNCTLIVRNCYMHGVIMNLSTSYKKKLANYSFFLSPLP